MVAATMNGTARLRALVGIARAANSALADPARLAAVVVEAATIIADSATVWTQSSTHRTLTRIGATHRDPVAEQVLRQAPGSITVGDYDGFVTAVTVSGVGAVLDPAEIRTNLDALDPALVAGLTARGISAVSIQPLRAEGHPTGILVVTRDTGGDAFTEDELSYLQAVAEMAATSLSTVDLLNGSAVAFEEMRAQAEIVNQVSDVIVSWDGDGRIVTWNTAAEGVYLYSLADAVGCDAHALLDTRFLDEDGEPLTFEDVIPYIRETGVWNGELRQRRADGEEVEIKCSLTGLPEQSGSSFAAIMVNHDVTEQRRKERLALNDALTGLPNRRFLTHHLAQTLKRWRPGTPPMGVFFLDLDGFKKVNDTMGHDAGDEVLRVTAGRLTEVLRGGDVVARLGGDEFVVICHAVGDRDSARSVAQRMIDNCAVPIPVGGEEPARVVPSIGIAMVDDDGAPADGQEYEADEVLKLADGAMYEAKRNKGTGPVFA
ncbi:MULTISPECIES: sensor domain-containing diguanylate cyclase [Catenuloplanes]|uniref:Diguanylate cyclase (GGDEF)-like protein/PAS domain S-box-containing protein n=1 Tax=Catenuloplanes niger TaxID=587534 RepID=A0AAE4CZ21_9ACTN|nr:sensor domain-containing diguanylate cyclase [Catenuloplanes niger]MDR7328168.1 diguanylate cyclase (GGDEF)-like protein/PAS domain S-box-containing protein [Catenuloplanes niger]